MSRHRKTAAARYWLRYLAAVFALAAFSGFAVTSILLVAFEQNSTVLAMVGGALLAGLFRLLAGPNWWRFLRQPPGVLTGALLVGLVLAGAAALAWPFVAPLLQ